MQVTITPDYACKKMGICLECALTIVSEGPDKLKKKDAHVKTVVAAVAEYLLASKIYMGAQRALVKEGITESQEKRHPDNPYSQSAVKASERFKLAFSELEKAYSATGLKCRTTASFTLGG